jgi:hypothetical protein
MSMRITTDIHGRLQIINIVGFLSVPILGYFDKTLLGLGIALTLSGIIFFAAFAYKTKSLHFDWTSQKIFSWLFEDYADRAANLCCGTFVLILGLVVLNHELG